LLRFWDRLDAQQRESLAAQIRAVDFSQIGRLVRQPDAKPQIAALAARAAPPPSFRLGDAGNSIPPETARKRGAEALGAGRVGAMLVAGGQGTRLGFDRPKGMFPIGPVSGKSLFQIHFEKLMAVARRYGVRIPLYLMTSPETHDQTVEYLDREHRFGLPAEDLCVFCQGTMPAVDATSGKVLLAGPDRLALSADGHGGMLAAFHRSGAMADAQRRGIRHLFYFQVDNPLVSVCDPEFLGYHLLSGSELTTQVVRKKDPMDKVGNVFAADGRLRVIEYSEFANLDPEIRSKRAADRSPVFWAGSIAVHAFDLALLARVAGEADAMPFHRALKKVACLDEFGRLIEPRGPNAIKFERFIFDLMPSADRAIVVEVDPGRHFAPLKNASGQAQDTPETVKAQMAALHRQWLRGAGFEVADQVPVEISPLFALDAREFATRIMAKKPITEPTYFG
jgi:UDP-N-acetylglucosamine/UDP-N-acetylgalactosamine diphosphorylase